MNHASTIRPVSFHDSMRQSYGRKVAMQGLQEARCIVWRCVDGMI
jgi:hypothetical protein